MREIDFLPSWYVARRTCLKYRRIRAGFLVTLLMVCGGWTLHAGSRISMVRAELNRLTADAAKIDFLKAQLMALQNRRAKLMAQERLLDELCAVPSPGWILARVAEVMPESIGLAEFSVKERDGADDSVEQIATLKGWTPNDELLGAFIASLSSSSHFKEVTLSYSRPEAAKSKLAREFELRLTAMHNGKATS